MTLILKMGQDIGLDPSHEMEQFREIDRVDLMGVNGALCPRYGLKMLWSIFCIQVICILSF